MKVLKNKKKGYTVSLEIEIHQPAIDTGMDKAFKDVSKTAKIPGFRQGKIPRNIFEKHYGKAMLLQEGISDAVNATYGDAIRELDLDVIDFPKNVSVGEYKENKGVTFSCDVDVRPDVKLGKYKGIKATKDADTADSNKVDEQLNQLRENFAEYKETDAAAGNDDLVSLNSIATIDGEPYEQWTRESLTVKVGLKNFGEDFDTEITGSKKGDKKSFAITYADDFSNSAVAGKTVQFEVEIGDIKEKYTPELDDALAKKVSNDQFDTVDALRADITEKLTTQAKQKSEEKLRADLIEALVADAKMDVPDAMVQSEIDYDIRQYEQQLKQSGGSIKQYLGMIGQSQEQFREQLKEAASKRVKSDLALSAVITKENLEATDDDIKKEIQTLLPTADTDEKVAAEMAKINLDGFTRMLTQRKAVEFLIEKAKIS